MLFVNELERITISAHFLFVSISQKRLAEDDSLNARLIYRHAFNTVGGDCALDQGVLA